MSSENTLKQWFSDLRCPGAPRHSENPQSQNYFHKNIKILFASSTFILSQVMSGVSQATGYVTAWQIEWEFSYLSLSQILKRLSKM